MRWRPRVRSLKPPVQGRFASPLSGKARASSVRQRLFGHIRSLKAGAFLDRKLPKSLRGNLSKRISSFWRISIKALAKGLPLLRPRPWFGGPRRRHGKEAFRPKCLQYFQRRRQEQANERVSRFLKSYCQSPEPKITYMLTLQPLAGRKRDTEDSHRMIKG